MITLFILGLVGAGVLFAAVPVVAFALMLETCADRRGVKSSQEMTTVRPARVQAGLRFAA